jgi:hypothetical protein
MHVRQSAIRLFTDVYVVKSVNQSILPKLVALCLTLLTRLNNESLDVISALKIRSS